MPEDNYYYLDGWTEGSTTTLSDTSSRALDTYNEAVFDGKLNRAIVRALAQVTLADSGAHAACQRAIGAMFYFTVHKGGDGADPDEVERACTDLTRWIKAENICGGVPAVSDAVSSLKEIYAGQNTKKKSFWSW